MIEKRRIIPLVIFGLSALFIIGSVNLFNFKTREEIKTESTDGTKGSITIEKEVSNNSIVEEEKKNQNETKEVLYPKNEEVTESSPVKKDEKKETSSSKKEETTSSYKVKKEEIKTEKKEETSNKNNTNEKKEETSKNSSTETNNNNQKVYEIPDEDSREKNAGSQDPEYLKIKATIEFETRSECQAALDDIMDKYLTDEHPMVSTSCKSFAYNGEVVGYRVLVTYGDGKYFYNN